ncbi:MAG: FHA domain-containing protein [Chloroflexota bacterium]|nr:FHA domain-containing protein [Chloroflexota bacterium]
MSVDEILLIGRVVFLAALYLFLIILALLLRRELRARGSTQEERAPADLLVVEPFESGLETGERIPLLARTTVGRDEENDVVLSDTFASSHHARLAWNGRGWVLEDIGSTNGTYVNGQQINKASVVKPGDTIEFGRVKFKLVPL